uniref:Thaumatin-like protein n=1 Tax=Setaria viridis TaxID=4556 RepID=A0A4U6T5K4_SETVI|nr:LOW QUALITY PROTEIN: hypothetical protein SEVIR_9G146900v2 [Setaria viridis]
MASVLCLLGVLLAAAIVVTNKCGYTVWPAALPGGGTVLNTGDSWSIDVPAGTRNGRVWGRMGCSFIANGTLGQCQTGDCGGTLFGKVGFSPVTLAEYSLGGGSGADYFDISLVHGFNAPMSFLPSGGGASRRSITFNCPFEQRAKAGCNNPCDGRSGSCGPNNGTERSRTTGARATPIYTCPPGTNYEITFCP